jgi:hypothetical protein
MLYLQDGLCYVTEPFHIFNLLFLLVAVSQRGHHYSLVRMIVICYTKSFLMFNMLCLLVAASHSGHQKSLVRGIVICCTKSVGTPHGGNGGMVSFAIPKNPAAPTWFWTSAIRCIRRLPGILQIQYRGAAYSDAGRRKKPLVK